jgi:hypothetical protein
MIKIHSNIIIGSPNDLAQIINNVNYIINCSTNLNNAMLHSNYLNLNITQFTFESLKILNSMYDFINNKIILNKNVFLLCETGIDNSLIVAMFILMKMLNLNYNNVYYKITTIYKIKSYDCYSGLKYYEPYILNNSEDKMDIS